MVMVTKMSIQKSKILIYIKIYMVINYFMKNLAIHSCLKDFKDSQIGSVMILVTVPGVF